MVMAWAKLSGWWVVVRSWARACRSGPPVCWWWCVMLLASWSSWAGWQATVSVVLSSARVSASWWRLRMLVEVIGGYLPVVDQCHGSDARL